MADDNENPFKGTPFEQLFNQLGGAFGAVPGGAAGGAAGMDLGAMFEQVQRMFAAPSDGPVNFTLAKDTARQALAAAGDDPVPHAGQVGAVGDALALADQWLDRATGIESGVRSSAAWSRAEWIEHSMPTWEVLITPIAEHVVSSMSDALPPEAAAMAGPLMGLLNQAGGAMFGQQVGQAIAALAGEVLDSTDVGLPLGPEGVAAVLPANIKAFAEGLAQSEADVLIYTMLREAAHQRLYAHATWLRPAIVGAIEEYGRGTRIDVSGIESKMREIDPTDPASMQAAMTEGMFDPEPTPEQKRAKERLELLLALVEGWVDHVVAHATQDTMPSAPALAETMRRRRAGGGPAEDTFATLVGLELRPRRLRDAANLWAAVLDQCGAEERDSAWSHPDLLPTDTDLDDPLGFAERRGGAGDFDAELRKLLEGDAGRDGGDDESR